MGPTDDLFKACTADTESYKIITAILAEFIVLTARPLRIRNVEGRRSLG